jgi:hypothetical protein
MRVALHEIDVFNCHPEGEGNVSNKQFEQFKRFEQIKSDL